MKKTLLVFSMVAFMAGCGQQEAPKAAEAAKLVPPSPAKTHHYSLRDGYEYGYERAVSSDDRNKGQAAMALLMAKYAGHRDGKYQVYSKTPEAPGAVIVAECTNPCEFMKTMVFYDGNLVSTDRLRVAPGVIGWMVLEDAINGQLEQFVAEKEGRKVTFWFDETKGLVVTPLVTKPPVPKS